MDETRSASKNKLQNKLDYRHHFQTIRAAISDAHRSSASGTICNKLLQHNLLKSATTISCYLSTGSEVHTLELVARLLSLGKNVVCPAIVGTELVLRQFSSLKNCTRGQRGILEPPITALSIDPNTVDLHIVPGLAFDAFKNRLGYGKGYYDRLLTNASGTKIGICFTDQLCYQLPREKHDIPMNAVISDTISL